MSNDYTKYIKLWIIIYFRRDISTNTTELVHFVFFVSMKHHRTEKFFEIKLLQNVKLSHQHPSPLSPHTTHRHDSQCLNDAKLCWQIVWSKNENFGPLICVSKNLKFKKFPYLCNIQWFKWKPTHIILL